MVKVLELFSGTGSVGKICRRRGYEVVSLDLILPATIKADILKWDYKVYPPGEFDLITASPVCAWWSNLRMSWIGRKLKCHGGAVCTKKLLQEDINKYGKPMVDRVFEILDYFEPRFWWVENPKTGRMKEYINNKPFHDVDYCRYADWGYQKRTRFWTNINFVPMLCEQKCNSRDGKKHKKILGGGTCIVDGKTIMLNNKKLRDKYRNTKIKYKSDISKDCSKYEKYRIPPNLIEALLRASVGMPKNLIDDLNRNLL